MKKVKIIIDLNWLLGCGENAVASGYKYNDNFYIVKWPKSNYANIKRGHWVIVHKTMLPLIAASFKRLNEAKAFIGYVLAHTEAINWAGDANEIRDAVSVFPELPDFILKLYDLWNIWVDGRSRC